MTEKKFIVVDDGFVKYIEDTTLTEDKHEGHIDDAYELCKELNRLYEENNKIKNILLNKKEELENDYNRGAKAGMPTGGIIGELDTIEDILEEMEWKNDKKNNW